MVGSALVRQLQQRPETELVLRSRKQLDLMDQQAVADFFQSEKIDQVYLAAAKVGGIHANNTYPAEFIYNNLMMECNIIHQAYQSGIRQLLFLGSSCIYPKQTPQPMAEESLLQGYLESTNEPYAIAKIAGIKLCESYNRQYGVDYRSVMPTNLYGENDNFHPDNSHVIPAMMRRFHEAKVLGDKTVTVWGTGKPRREFLHVDDMAGACIYVMNQEKTRYDQHVQPMMSHINVGTGEDCSIQTVAETLKNVIGFRGDIVFDKTKPDGTPRKLMNVSRMNRLGWKSSVPLQDGLEKTYQWFLKYEGEWRVR
ncbi:GDP-L-fucose synthase [invertebrate metagenome]|uniref:GDP-L-fucose synthase n=1 Tax=invertebrate metagenome TaxID=1711999 RepID=A0A2H9T9F7_9ZZZZ